MKQILTIALVCLGWAANAQQQTIKVKVYGNCEMCKERIEEAANKVQGVSFAEWSTETEQLTVKYDATKASRELIENEIVAVGHDLESKKSDRKVYKSLPFCCQYTRENIDGKASSVKTLKIKVDKVKTKEEAFDLQNEIYSMSGVKSSEVDLNSKMAIIMYDTTKVQAEKIQAKVNAFFK